MLQICAVYDSKAKVFGRPFFTPHLAQAIRGFQDEVNNPEGGDLNKHPEDFDLYHLGEFEESTGSFDNAQRPSILCTAASLLKP
ncbi:MAG: nonstructural protein [Microvirus sp.]|nr:MAG: nonstructural protein [Microvirus sp.]